MRLAASERPYTLASDFVRVIADESISLACGAAHFVGSLTSVGASADRLRSQQARLLRERCAAVPRPQACPRPPAPLTRLSRRCKGERAVRASRQPGTAGCSPTAICQRPAPPNSAPMPSPRTLKTARRIFCRRWAYQLPSWKISKTSIPTVKPSAQQAGLSMRLLRR